MIRVQTGEPSTIEDVFANIKTRQIGALMVHKQMIDYFGFLGLAGFKRMHEYQYVTEGVTSWETDNYYTTRHGRLLKESFEGEVKVIPASMENAVRTNVSRMLKQKAVEDAFSEYQRWESETKTFYGEHAEKARELGMEFDALYIDELVRDVDTELAKADELIVRMSGTGYDMTYILDMQDDLLCEYTKKIKRVFR